jgi:ELWxxDGT repeat protein
MSAYYDDGTNGGRELVFTDGTTAGTKVFGYNSSYPTILGEVNGLLYFTATDADGLGLFTTDGTTFSKKVALGSSGGSILGYTDSIAYFAITDASHGQELWAANLSTGTLALTKDILAGSGGALSGINTYDTTTMPKMVGDSILFNAYTTDTIQSLFVSDGTDAGTVQLSSTLPVDKAIIGNKVFFTNAQGLYEADLSATTVAATQVVAGSFGTANTYPVVDRLQSDTDQAFYLTADNKLNVATTATDSIQLADHVSKFKVVAENALYFIETNSSNVASLWYSDGTATGTRYIEDLTLSADSYDLANAVAIHTVGVSTV